MMNGFRIVVYRIMYRVFHFEKTSRKIFGKIVEIKKFLTDLKYFQNISTHLTVSVIGTPCI